MFGPEIGLDFKPSRTPHQKFRGVYPRDRPIPHEKRRHAIDRE